MNVRGPCYRKGGNRQTWMHRNASDDLWTPYTNLPSHLSRVLKCDLCLSVLWVWKRACVIVPTHTCVHREGETGGKTKLLLTYKKTQPDHRWTDQLVNQNLLGHGFHGSARVESVQPLVPVVHAGTQGNTHSKHGTFRNKKEISINANSLYSIWNRIRQLHISEPSVDSRLNKGTGRVCVCVIHTFSPLSWMC